MFNLRVVRADDIRNVYTTVDIVLAKSKMSRNDAPSYEMQRLAAFASLKHLINSRYFCIVSFRTICEMFNHKASTERMNWLRTLHCVDYGDMDQTLKQTLIAVIFDELRPYLLEDEAAIIEREISE